MAKKRSFRGAVGHVFGAVSELAEGAEYLGKTLKTGFAATEQVADAQLHTATAYNQITLIKTTRKLHKQTVKLAKQFEEAGIEWDEDTFGPCPFKTEDSEEVSNG